MPGQRARSSIDAPIMLDRDWKDKNPISSKSFANKSINICMCAKKQNAYPKVGTKGNYISLVDMPDCC